MSEEPQAQLSFAEAWPTRPGRAPRLAPPALDAEQLSFDWALPVALGPEDFFVSESNADAQALVAGGLRWPENRMVLVGPPGSGKTHLARIWQAATGAERLEAAELDPEGPPPPAGAALVVEDMERLPREAEARMLHLHNHLLATGGRLLMTADRPPALWGVRLADLRSRVEAAAVARIEAPDDALIQALLAKMFADRQIHPAPEVLAFAARRIERSHRAVARAVDAVDRLALRLGRPVSLPLVRSVLEVMGGGVPDREFWPSPDGEVGEDGGAGRHGGVTNRPEDGEP